MFGFQIKKFPYYTRNHKKKMTSVLPLHLISSHCEGTKSKLDSIFASKIYISAPVKI